jgi:hypothetical protein
VSSTPPVATAGTTGKASFVFAVPTGGDLPSDLTATGVITAEVSTDNGTTWTAATLDTPGAVTIATGNVTVKVKSLTAGSVKLRAVVTGNNGKVSRTPASNAVTIS